MPIEVTLPKLSPTMESGTIVRWLFKPGDTVKEGDTLAEVQTDKAVMPMESFDVGVIAHLDVQEGESIAVGQRILVLAKKGEDPKQVAQQVGQAGTGATSQGGAEGKPSASSAEAARSASPNGKSSESGDSLATAGGRVRSTPLARKIAAEANIDLGQIPGSGPGGRVIRDDVEAFLQGRTARPAAARPAAVATTPAPAATAPAPAARRPAPSRTAAPVAPGQTTRVPHSPMRKTIAKRMVDSKQAIPEIHVTVDVRIDKLMAIRETLNKQLASEGVKLSVGDFVTKAAALALRAHPGVNASFEPEAMVLHSDVNIGIAVAIEGGLMVPVLHHADTLGLRDIRIGSEALAEATRGGTLKPNQMMGGTFTISNLGMYGVKQFDAIINQPEVAILAVGAGEKRPVVEGNTLVVGTVMSLTLTADHRAVDGALAAEFMRTLKGFLEDPSTMLL